MTREAFCNKVGLDATQPFITYLGSSENIATDESWLVRELARALRQHPNSEARKINILVRPHPGHAKHFESLKEEVTIWPRGGAFPDSKETLRDFRNSLCHCVATVGLNNSAMLESIINDKPCVTIITERYKKTQMQAGHFRHLLNFDVLEMSTNCEECADVLVRLWRGNDSTKQARQKFMQDFIRPRGSGRPAGEVAARAIMLAATRMGATQIDRILSHPNIIDEENDVKYGRSE